MGECAASSVYTSHLSESICRSLENNSDSETLALQHCMVGEPFPCAYIKIGMYILLIQCDVINVCSYMQCLYSPGVMDSTIASGMLSCWAKQMSHWWLKHCHHIVQYVRSTLLHEQRLTLCTLTLVS